MIEFGYRTDIGKKRSCNEDALLVMPKQRVFAVADGVGGHGGGDVASRKAISGIEAYVRSNPIIHDREIEGLDEANWFKSYFARCLAKINSELISMRASATGGDGAPGMATTLVLMYIGDKSIHIANIGDSRAYLISEEGILKLTKDHSYVGRLVDAGIIDKDEADEHPRRNEITRAMGATPIVEPDFYEIPVHESDRLMLCTDGLYGAVAENTIREIVLSSSDLSTACKSLVNEANKESGDDNITVVAVRIKGERLCP